MLTPEKNGRFVSILADGKLHETVPAGTDGAQLREYETSDGKKGEKWELVYVDIKDARITDIGFKDGDYGTNLLITFTFEGGEEVILSQGIATKFGENIMKKLPNIVFSEKVTFKPYAFEGENGKPVTGVSIYQGHKVEDFFYEEGEDGEKGKVINGYPVPEGDTKTYTKDDWKVHFILARKFLVNYTKDNVIPKLGGSQVPTPAAAPGSEMAYPDDEINPEDIPF